MFSGCVGRSDQAELRAQISSEEVLQIKVAAQTVLKAKLDREFMERPRIGGGCRPASWVKLNLGRLGVAG